MLAQLLKRYMSRKTTQRKCTALNNELNVHFNKNI